MGRKSNLIKLVEKRIADAEARLQEISHAMNRLTIENKLVVASLEWDRELLRVISETPETKKEAAKDGANTGD